MNVKEPRMFAIINVSSHQIRMRCSVEITVCLGLIFVINFFNLQCSESLGRLK